MENYLNTKYILALCEYRRSNVVCTQPYILNHSKNILKLVSYLLYLKIKVFLCSYQVSVYEGGKDDLYYSILLSSLMICMHRCV